jgi:FAD:protein FMN transferase
MGTLVGVTLFADSEDAARAGFAAAFARIRAMDALLSDYRADSEVNAITTRPMRVSRELWRILTFAQRLAARSGGAFDVTVGPLTRLWRQKIVPGPEALEHVGFRHLRLREGKAWFDREGMRLDLGAIGKGFAADEALAVLRGPALVAASGDIVCGDAPPGERGWQVAAAGRRLALRRGAVSTSGDTEQFFERGGVRYSHIIDQRTGLAATTQLEVSVTARCGMAADALATAARVLGVAAGAALARRYGATVLV